MVQDESIVTSCRRDGTVVNKETLGVMTAAAPLLHIQQGSINQTLKSPNGVRKAPSVSKCRHLVESHFTTRQGNVENARAAVQHNKVTK